MALANGGRPLNGIAPRDDDVLLSWHRSKLYLPPKHLRFSAPSLSPQQLGHSTVIVSVHLHPFYPPALYPSFPRIKPIASLLDDRSNKQT